MINTSGLTKSYKRKIVVNNVAFTVETGKVTGFLGPNGAGKSTTMRLMLGLDNGGKTTFDDKALASFMTPSKTVGILLEAKAFHPTRSARNHLRVLAAAGGIPESRVEEVLTTVGLHQVANKKPGKFSLGMSQRLGIAAAILGSPKYLMLDEPANGLDPEGIAWLRSFIRSYADAGNAVFISSHQLSEMSQMADSIVVIGKGKLITQASVTELLAGSSKTGITARTADNTKFGKLLTKHGFTFEMTDQTFSITAKTTEEIAKLAFDARIMLTELSVHKASLEQAFLELTENSQEYKSLQESSHA